MTSSVANNMTVNFGEKGISQGQNGGELFSNAINIAISGNSLYPRAGMNYGGYDSGLVAKVESDNVTLTRRQQWLEAKNSLNNDKLTYDSFIGDLKEAYKSVEADVEIQGIKPDVWFMGFYTDYNGKRLLVVPLIPTSGEGDVPLYISYAKIATGRGVVSTVKADGTIEAGLPIREISSPLTKAFRGAAGGALKGKFGGKYLSSDDVRAFANIRVEANGEEGEGLNSGVFTGMIFDVKSFDDREVRFKNYRKALAQKAFDMVPESLIQAKYGKRAVQIIKNVDLVSDIAARTPQGLILKKGGKYAISKIARNKIATQLAENSTLIIGYGYTSLGANFKIKTEENGEMSLSLSDEAKENAQKLSDKLLEPVIERLGQGENNNNVGQDSFENGWKNSLKNKNSE